VDLRRFLRNLVPARLRMARAWEDRARRNAMHYVADHRAVWDDEAAFFQTGADDTAKLLGMAGWGDTSGGRLLEIGCGVGRMTRHLSRSFEHVTAIDISPTMISKAKALNASTGNARFEVSSGTDLGLQPDAHFDFVLSYIVFQHIPEANIVYCYVREAVRVLKPGGRFLFQVRNDPGYVPHYDTYDGAAVDLPEIQRVAEGAGSSMLRTIGAGTQYCFIEIQKLAR